MKISVIVPCFNEQKYIKRCIDSLLEQDYSGDYELVLVDDGSTDNCPKILDSYAEKEPEKVIVIHQSNKGLSAARNVGTISSHGDFITYVDADDSVDRSYLSTLGSVLSNTDADISIVKHIDVFQNVTLGKDNETSGEKITLYSSPEEALMALFYSKISNSACAKLYKRELVTSALFPEGRVYEDYATTYRFIAKAEKTVYCDSVQYYYWQNENSIIHSKINQKRIDDFLLAKQEIADYFAYSQDLKKASDFMFATESNLIISMLSGFSFENRAFYLTMKKAWRPLIKDILPSVSQRAKLKIIIIYSGYVPMCFYYYFYNKLHPCKLG